MRGTGWPWFSAGTGAATFISDLHRLCFQQCAHQGLFTDRYFERVLRARARVPECHVSGLRGQGFVQRLALKEFFGLARAPRYTCNAAERDARLTHRTPLKMERHGRGGHCELIRLPITYL